jgi:hypothetical protein
MTSSHDDKLVAVMRAVLQLHIERRNVVLRHIASRLPIYDTGCSDSDFDKAMRVVLRELILRMALQDLAQHVDALKNGPLGSSSAVPDVQPNRSNRSPSIAAFSADVSSGASTTPMDAPLIP